VVFDEALAVPGGLGDAGFEDWRRKLEGILRDGVDDLNDEQFKR
jgi:hypothetical protein